MKNRIVFCQVKLPEICAPNIRGDLYLTLQVREGDLVAIIETMHQPVRYKDTPGEWAIKATMFAEEIDTRKMDHPIPPAKDWELDSPRGHTSIYIVTSGLKDEGVFPRLDIRTEMRQAVVRFFEIFTTVWRGFYATLLMQQKFHLEQTISRTKRDIAKWEKHLGYIVTTPAAAMKTITDARNVVHSLSTPAEVTEIKEEDMNGSY